MEMETITQTITRTFGAIASTSAQAVCPIHGPYTAKTIRLGGKIVSVSKCPECAAIEAASQAREKAREKREADALRRQESAAADLLRSCIPQEYAGKSFDNFACITENQRAALALSERFVNGWDNAKAGGYGLLFFGPCGTGKTHLACAIAHKMLTRGVFSLYTRVYDLIRYVRSSWGQCGEFNEYVAIRRFVDADLLILDEVGVQAGSENERQILFSVIDARLSENRPTIFLSNIGPDKLVGTLGERIVDRIRAKCVPFQFKGKSFRRPLSADVFG